MAIIATRGNGDGKGVTMAAFVSLPKSVKHLSHLYDAVDGDNPTKEDKQALQKAFIDHPGLWLVVGDQAHNAADILTEWGRKAIWNFSARPISAPHDTIVENTSIASSLAMIKWKLNKNKPLIYKNRIL